MPEYASFNFLFKKNLKGGQSITISGTNFPLTLSDSIKIGNKQAQILSQTSTQIVILSPALASGTYSLIIPCGASIGYARFYRENKYIRDWIKEIINHLKKKKVPAQI